MKTETAINVIEEASAEYWGVFERHHENSDIRRIIKRLSLHDIRLLFDYAVIPAINEVRRLDRGGEPKSRDRRHINQVIAELIKDATDNVPKDTRRRD